MVRLDECTVVGNFLVTGQQRVAIGGIGESRAPSVVIDFAITTFGESSHLVTGHSIGVRALRTAAEIAQVGLKFLRFAKREYMHSAQKVLAIIVLQRGVVVLEQQVAPQLVVNSGESETVTLLAPAADSQSCAIA